MTGASSGCWGIGFGAAGVTNAKYLRNANFSNNVIINGGNVALTVAECPNCVIENNFIIQDWPYEYALTGMVISADSVRAIDDTSDTNRIRNNTIWFGPNAIEGGTGIEFGTVGTGHTVVNNTITYSATTEGNSGGVNCFKYPRPLSEYAFLNNNHCFSNATYSWEATEGSLAEWQAYAAVPGFDTESFTADPLFTAPGTDFTPGPGSPLIGAGSAAHGSALDITGATRPSPPAIGAYEP